MMQKTNNKSIMDITIVEILNGYMDGYIHYVGRNDDIIKSSGYSIHPLK